ncbi:hypothetical protein Q2366_26990, partial [Escherichia coli]|nr:hypothetical protein [Escherichia coli]
GGREPSQPPRSLLPTRSAIAAQPLPSGNDAEPLRGADLVLRRLGNPLLRSNGGPNPTPPSEEPNRAPRAVPLGFGDWAVLTGG